MRRSELSKALAWLALLPPAAGAQTWLTQEGDVWVRTIHQSAPAKPRVHIVSHGPVVLEGNVAGGFEFTVKISVRARNREQARMMLERVVLTPEVRQDVMVLRTPGGPLASSVEMRAPRLQEAIVSSSDGQVQAIGIDGPLTVLTGADLIRVDRIHGDCTLSTGGGDINVGTVDGFLHCTTGAGAITAKQVGGEAEMRTNGGDIRVIRVNGQVHAETGGGTVQLGYVKGAVTAINGGGPIQIDAAEGVVTTHNMAGPVKVSEAAGIRCDSANGGIVLGRISGPIHVSTAVGNIVANLVGSKLAASYIATGSGDITVTIPSNLGVTISAENQMADSIRRILSDFREIQPRLRGMRLQAEGRVNGGGPLLQISASSGTIFLKRTQ